VHIAAALLRSTDATAAACFAHASQLEEPSTAHAGSIYRYGVAVAEGVMRHCCRAAAAACGYVRRKEREALGLSQRRCQAWLSRTGSTYVNAQNMSKDSHEQIYSECMPRATS
jgi:hypothetical protein